MKLAIHLGDKYGRLTIIKELPSHVYPAGDTQRRILCRCECGKEVAVNLGSLRSKHTTSCGCYNAELNAKRQLRHGMSKTSENRIYRGMKGRCFNKNNQDWQQYGGRGISVCERWLGPNGFKHFLEDMGRRPSRKHQIDRIDNDKGYSPDNCRWATIIEQRRNTRVNRMITYKGKTQCLADWCDDLSIEYCVLQTRLDRGWPVEKAFTYHTAV